ncbi:MAG: 2-phosphosulfolactate phosphatase [Ignavibacteria bacterium]|nr:MAG: 2-phosphosulfolactate phosphatase [Ignavibacteria bacterium]KAF0161462.1 MAG: 2-phosphosulfolactate phosphatase [Ignavibacteria bacterium]
MKINVHYSTQHLDELYFTGKTSVVIDVLRATSVIVTALTNGAREVIPVSTVDFAMKVSGNAFSGQTLLCGERNTKKIEGFVLGNSPLEFTQEVVNGRSIILYTTNGSKTVVKAKFSENLFAACFQNLPVVAKHLVTLNKDVEILCSGNNGNFSLEDTICAGKLAAEIVALYQETQLTDSSRASMVLAKSIGKNLFKMLKETEHGKLLIENGFDADIKECSLYGVKDVIPYFVSGSLKKLDLPENNSEITAS